MKARTSQRRFAPAGGVQALAPTAAVNVVQALAPTAAVNVVQALAPTSGGSNGQRRHYL